ncbi:type II toxin-antitoxin system antitoxin SocA domain-containing protein [Oscillibacter sp.]|uniref:Panacea domain-containing protein n=1 Tax=Oscillibacter sp. TaxID=1945593 RepID=UPI00289FD2D4|nr:type II toxin-antitoxin system antitoxin SocA domain-containing protein [Oscillibacter sp.]
MPSAQAVSNAFLLKAFSDTEGVKITPMKLQKLIYFAYRDYLQGTGRKAFNDAIQKWKYGPVVQSVYDEFKSFGQNPINRFAKDAQGKAYLPGDRELLRCIDDVWNRYKYFSGVQLSQMTHKDGTAWSKAFEDKIPYLKDDDIRNERQDC